jgi:hypothetical protein
MACAISATTATIMKQKPAAKNARSSSLGPGEPEPLARRR